MFRRKPSGMRAFPEKRMTAETMISDRTDNQGTMAARVVGSVLLVNLFTPKAGMSNAFIEAQTGEYVRLKGKVKGWIGNRLGRTVDGSGQLVNVALFDSMDNYNAWRSSQLFADHVDVIKPFVEKSAPGMYELLYSAGEI
jgi:heme-degrading monooxygenase HmoA